MTTRQRVRELLHEPLQEYIRLSWQLNNHAEILADILARFAGHTRKPFGDEGTARCSAFLHQIGMRTSPVPEHFRQATTASALKRMVAATTGAKATGVIDHEFDGTLTIGIAHRSNRGVIVMRITPIAATCELGFHELAETTRIAVLSAAFQHLSEFPECADMGALIGRLTTQLGKRNGSAA